MGNGASSSVPREVSSTVESELPIREHSHTSHSGGSSAQHQSPSTTKAATSSTGNLSPDRVVNDWPSSRWLGVRTELDVFDDDFLESLPYPNASANGVGGLNGGNDDIVPNGSSSSGVSTATGVPNSSLHGSSTGATSKGGADRKLGDLEMSLWMADVEPSILLGHANKTLSTALSRQCRRADVFSKRISRQLFALQNVHQALTSFSHSIERRIREVVSNTQSDCSLATGNDRKNELTAAQKQLGHGAQLGVSLFFTLLDCVSDVDSSSMERQAFLHDLTPIITELDPHSFIRTLSAKNSMGILDALRDFLFTASLPGPEECILLKKSGILTEKEFDVAGRLDLDDRTGAITSLVALACIRGSLCDLLMAVKVLLSVCWSPCSSSPVSQSENKPDSAESVPLQQQTKLIINTASSKTPIPQMNGAKLDLRKGKARNRKMQKNALATDVQEREEQLMIERAAKDMNDVAAYRVTAVQQLETSGSAVPSDTMASAADDSKLPAGNAAQSDNSGNHDSKTSAGAEGKEISKKQQLLLEAKQRNAALVPGGNDDTKHYHRWIQPLTNVCGYLQQLEVAKCRPVTPGSTGVLSAGVNQEREVWTFGQNSYGELVQGDTATRKVPCRVPVADGKNIVRVAAGNEHTVMLSADGLLYTAGYNDNGQCGQGSTERVGKLTVVEELRGQVVTQIHAYNGCEHTLIVTQEGKLYSFGYNYRGQLGQGSTSSIFSPRIVRGLESRKVVTVSCSYYHSVVSCATGEIFAFGRNDFGQLGLGDNTDRKEPTHVELPEAQGEGARSIACGQYHTMIATASGHAYAFGKNDYGQLGLISNECQRRPVRLEAPIFEDGGVAEFRCGYYHTLCLLESSHVFSFGRNDYGQLGLGHTTQRVFGPQLVETLVGKDVVGLSAGCYHSVAVANSGALYVFGRNNHGQLGTGDDAERHSPWLIGTFTGKRVAMVAAGFYHTIVLTGCAIDSNGGKSEEEDSLPQSAAGLLALPRYKLPKTNVNADQKTRQSSRGKNSNLTMSPKPHVDPENPGQQPVSPFSLASRSPTTHPNRINSSDDPAWRDPVNDNEVSSVGVSALKSKSASNPVLSPDPVQIDPEHAAIFIMGHLDRLAASYIPQKGDYPSLYSPPSARVKPSTEDNSFGTYCVDTRPETFSLLLSFFSLTGVADENCDVQKSVRPQVVLACLRLLRANLAKLIRSGHVGSSLEPILSALKSKVLDMIRSPSEVIGQGNKTLPASASQILTAIQRESAAVLIVGLQLFYPNADDVVSLFSALMAAISSPELPVLSNDATPCSGALANFLLSPLAKRLQEDSMIVFLFMNQNLGSLSENPVKNLTAGDQPVTMLTSALLRRIADDGNAAVVAAMQMASQEGTFDEERDSAKSENGKNENSIDFIALTLALQKHILSFAGRDASKIVEETETMNEDVCLSYVLGEEGLGEKVEVKLKKRSNDIGLEILIGYALELVERSMEIVNQIVTWSEESRGTLQPGPVWKALHEGPVGRILPSLMTGLILFTKNHSFALKFLSRFSNMLALLDRLLGFNADVLAFEQARMQNLDESFDGQQNNHRRKKMDLRVESASNLRGKPFEWIVDLEKTIAVLTSRMAATLLTGESLVEGRMKTFKKHPFFPTKSICTGGLEDTLIRNIQRVSPLVSSYASFGGQLARVNEVLSAEKPVGVPEAEDEVTQVIKGWVKGLGLCKLERDQFMKKFVAKKDPGVQKLLEWLRAGYTRQDPQYRMSILQLRQTTDVANRVDEVELAAAAATFKHAGLVPDLMLYYKLACGNALGAHIEVPKRFLLLWKAPAKIRKYLLLERLKLMRESSDEVPLIDPFSDLCSSALKVAKCILCFKASKQCTRQLSSPSDPGTAGFSGSKLWIQNASNWRFDGLPFLRRHPRSRWRGVRTRVFILIRWRALARQSRCLSSEKVVEEVPEIVCETLSTPNYSAATLLFSAVVSSEVAASRAAGFFAFERLVDSVQLSSLKAEIIRPLGPALRDSAGTSALIFNRLSLSNDKVRQIVWQNFSSLFKKLTKILQQSASKMEGINGTDARLMSVIIDAWGLEIGKSSLIQRFLSKSSLLKIIRGIAFGELGDAGRGKGSTKDGEELTPLWCTNPTVLPRNTIQHNHLYSWVPFVRECAWRLYRFLILQLGVDSKTVVADYLENHVSKGNKPILSPDSIIFDMFYKDTCEMFRKFLSQKEKALKNAKVPSSLRADNTSTTIDSGTPPQYPRMAHSQDIIDYPHYLSSGESGLVVPGTKVLPNSSTGDFSLTFWTLLTQDATGESRIIMLRGSHSDFSPLIALNANDRTIEVTISQKNSNTSAGSTQERLPSKSSLPLHKWTHIAVVSEAAQLRLYINGVLDAQRTNYTGVYRKSNSTRFPIYVGKLPDSNALVGSPYRDGMEGAIAKLRYHSRALSPIHVRVDCEKGLPVQEMVSDEQCYQMCLLMWLSSQSSHCLGFLSQQRWLQILFDLLQNGTHRLRQTATRLLRVIVPVVNADALVEIFGTSKAAAAHGVIDRFLDIAGKGLWHFQPNPNSSGPTFNVASASYGTKVSSAEITNFTYNFSSEVINMLRRLAASNLWGEYIKSSLVASLKSLRDCFSCTVTPEESDQIYTRGLAAIAVLGGHIESLRIGGRVSLSHTNLSATVLSFDCDINTAAAIQSATSAHIAMIETHEQKSSNTNVLKAVRMNTEELRAVPETDCPYDSRSFEGISNATVDALLPLLKRYSETEAGLIDPLSAITFSSTLKSICGMLHSVQGIKTAGGILERGLLKYLMKIAVNTEVDSAMEKDQSDGSVTALEVLECKAVQLRQRLFQIQNKITEGIITKDSEPEKTKIVDQKGEVPTVPASDNNVSEMEKVDLTHLDLASDDNPAEEGFPSAYSMDTSQSDKSLASVAVQDTIMNPPTAMVDELMAMGFPEEWCVTALRENDNDMVSASTWIVDNLDMLSQLRHEDCEDGEEDEDDDEEDEDDVNDSLAGTGMVQQESPAIDRNYQSRESLDLFEESFFPSDLTQESPQYGASWYDGTSSSTFGVRQTKLATIASQISAVKRKDVEGMFLQVENLLSSLYAQHIVLDVLKLWLANRQSNSTNTVGLDFQNLGNSDVLLNFLKFSFSRRSLIKKCDVVVPLKVNSSVVIDKLKQPGMQKMLKIVIIQLLLDTSKEVEDKNLFNCIIERAVKEFENTLLYLDTDIVPTDSQGFGAPCVAFGHWLISVILDFRDQPGTLKYTESLFLVLLKCSASSNFRMNGIMYSLLSKMLYQTVEQMKSSDPGSDQLALYRNRLSGWASSLSAIKLLNLAETRLQKERENGRLLLSVYLQRIVNVNVAISEAMEALSISDQSEPKPEDMSETSDEPKVIEKFTFDRLHCGPSIDISENGLSATFSSSESWSTVLGNVGLMVGKNSWEIHIERSPTAYLFVGIATKDANLSTFLGGDDHGWGYIGDRALYHKRNKVKLYGERFGQGDTVGVTLDMDEGTLSFSKNGEDLGVAIQNLSGVLFPAVAFYNRGQQVSLLPHSFSLPGAGMDIPGSPSSIKLSKIVKAGLLMRNFALGRKFTKSMVHDMYLSYKKWYYSETVRHCTQSGFDLQLDTSREALKVFGFSAGEQIATVCGVATVVGVSQGRLWRSIEDDDRGIWFFSTRELGGEKAAIAGVEEGERKEVAGTSKKVRPAGCESVSEKSADCDGRLVSLSQSLPVLDFETFAKHTFARVNVGGSQSLDAVLVTVVNEFCFAGREDIVPWNITPKQIFEDIMPSMKKRLLSIRSKEDKVPKVFRQESASRESDSLDFGLISARFALLRVLNDYVIGLFPFADMSGEYEKPLLCNEFLPENSRQNGVHGFNIGRTLGKLRGCIFLSSKRAQLNTAIRRTTTRAKKAEDDYDYPEDLPQVVLNRPKAVLARDKLDSETRLSYSVFGQSFDELHFLEPSSLRMGYTHPMDDGQERTFKVKFEGEGVDDYGGPYREFFSQIIEELQGLKTKEEGDQDVSCVLPLLLPSPNQRKGVGENQQHFVLNPGTVRSFSGSAPLYVEMYNFLGQVIGIALRSRVHLALAFPSILWKVMVSSPLEWDDLSNFDDSVCAILKGLLRLVTNQDDSVSQTATDILNELGWETRLSDGSVAQLRIDHDTGDKQVAGNFAVFKDVVQYAILVVQCRLTESEPAMRALREGLLSVVPAAVLPLLTWSELEVTVCGREEIDVELLKSNTEYDDDVSPEDEHIKWMWEILDEWGHEHRRAFLRFVWARAHLPPTAKEFKQRFKVQALVGDGPRNTPDKFLPKAHTCFFSINLPRYTNKETMAKRLMYAIYNCVEMDADFRLTGNESTGWTL